MALRVPRIRPWMVLFVLPIAALWFLSPSFMPRSVLGTGVASNSLPTNQTRCWFSLDMRILRQEIPDVVGDCIENAHFNPDNGDTLQRTTGGLMVWRHADRSAAFTDGQRTWAKGPNGLESRANDERFEWEAPPEAAKPTEIPPAASKPPVQATASPTATPRAVVVTTPQAQIGGALGSVAAAAIPSTNELITSATEMVLVSSLKSSGLPVQGVASLTAATDPDKLLGQPGQYSSKIVWKDARAGADEAAIELFPDAASMQTRLQALQSIPKTSPQYTPYVSGDPARKTLIRLPKGLAPDQVQGYQRWLSTVH